MSDFDKKIFEGKSISDLYKDIYNNHKKADRQIMESIDALKPFITSAGTAVQLVQYIVGYMNVKVQNDEHLVKMASIVQRAITNAKDTAEDFILTEAEKQQLLSSSQEPLKLLDEVKQLEKQSKKSLKNED